ncbi:MAG: cyclopropane-fatty-acyl-phospholipid synthase [Gammaproteobacteria bacterium]|nr:cyclopropane-fatty-acyl-phospholipid synthase [Gammaproteobacteria bacterium]MDD9896793.1 cyclopropane-fatty-acyl-phospholipid synthase [Gammaproteobacteria bacterium]
MSQKEWTITDSKTEETVTPKSVEMLRSVLIRVLNHASEGHFLLREKGRIIAEVGDRKSSLKAEVNILDTRAYRRALLGGNTAAGEAFVEGWWTSPDITQVTRFFSRNLSMMDYWDSRFGWLLKPFSLIRLLNRANSKKQAKKNILAHYDLGNDLYQTFLDSRMQYSSALYRSPEDTLQQAQKNKLTRICEQLQLGQSDHLLEVGSGWGGLAIFAAKNYGCRVTTTTISDEQFRFAQQEIEREGLSDHINLLSRDYRLLDGQYDKVVSVEMIEAVGKKYLPGYFQKLNDLLKPSGLLMLQAITIADQRFKAYSRGEDFIQKHIFPGGFLPSLNLISKLVANSTELVVRDILDIGLDYAQTLGHWHENLKENRDYLLSQGYDDRFYNLWSYYLGYCEGGFRERRISAAQILASKAPHIY